PIVRYSANKDDEPNRRLLADLSALADGTSDAARESTVREQMAASPRLRGRYERERRAVAALYATRADRAPARVRARIEAQRRGAERADGGWLVPRSRFAYGGFAAVVAAAVAVALLLPGGTPGGPSVSEAAALALRGSAQPAPAP